VWLQEAGYNTYYTGKLFNVHSVTNYDSPYPAGWTGTVSTDGGLIDVSILSIAPGLPFGSIYL
jgi:hypothetical protein